MPTPVLAEKEGYPVQRTLEGRAIMGRTNARPVGVAGPDRWSRGVVIAASALSLGSTLYFHLFTDMVIVAGDMSTHLNLARRVLDNLTPVLANLGGYWLPLLHALTVPLVWNDTLWRSGLAGGIVSMGSFIAGSLFTFRLARLLLEDDVAALIAALIFLTNPILLYFQTSPLFEPLLVATFIGAVYYLARWALRGQQLADLMLCALWTALATLVRQDNWMLLPAVSLLIHLVSRRLWTDRDHREAVLSVYVPLASQGVLIFILVLNWLSLGTPLYFLSPSFHRTIVDGKAIVGESTDVLYVQYTQCKPVVSLLRYVLTAAHSIGFVLYPLFVLGLVVFIVRHRLSNRALAAYVLLAPYLFFWIMLFLRGHPPIMVPELPPYHTTYWNVRYGITALPAAALFCGYLTRGSIWRKALMLCFVAAQLGLFISGSAFYPSRTPEINASLALTEEEWDTFEWFSANYDEGLVLMSTYKAGDTISGDTIIIHSGLDNQQFIHEGTQHYWRESLVDPGRHAYWILTKKGDELRVLMDRNPDRFSSFELVYESDTNNYRIFQKS